MADIPIISGDILRMTATFLVDQTDVCQLVWHMVADNDALQDTAVLGSAAVAQMETAFVVIDQAVSDAVQGSTLDIALYNTALNTWNTIVTGSISSLIGINNSPYLPLGTNLLILMFTERAKALAKKFWFGFCESDHNNGLWDASALLDAALWAQGQFTALIAGLNIWLPCTFNQETLDTNLMLGVFQAEANAAYQRRRKPGVGL